ncbi:MAG: hypothetical protein ACFCU3_00560 [Verrucomicrobiales bacterium]
MNRVSLARLSSTLNSALLATLGFAVLSLFQGCGGRNQPYNPAAAAAAVPAGVEITHVAVDWPQGGVYVIEAETGLRPRQMVAKGIEAREMERILRTLRFALTDSLGRTGTFETASTRRRFKDDLILETTVIDYTSPATAKVIGALAGITIQGKIKTRRNEVLLTYRARRPIGERGQMMAAGDVDQVLKGIADEIAKSMADSIRNRFR